MHNVVVTLGQLQN